MLTYFVPQVRHQGGVAFRLRLVIGNTDVILAGASGQLQHGVGIELLVGHIGGRAPLTGFFLLLPALLVRSLTSFFLCLTLPLQLARFLVLQRLEPAIFRLLRFVLLLSPLFLLLRPLLLRAFRGRAPDRFGSFMPALLAEVAGGWNLASANTALV